MLEANLENLLPPLQKGATLNLMKIWVVDRMARGLYQNDHGPVFWVAVGIRTVWGRGFDSA